MEKICIILSLIFILIIVKNSHNAILLFAASSILFQDYLCLRYNSPNITLYFMINSIAVGYIIVKKGIYFKDFPLKRAFCFLFFTYIVGVLASPLSFSQTIPYAIGKILSYIFVVIFFNELQSYKDIKFCFICTLSIIFFLCIYSSVEFGLQMNPWLTYIVSLYPDEMTGKIYQHFEVRFFSIRCQSLLSISISWGAVCALWMSFIIYLKDIAKSNYISKILFILSILLAFNVFISGARSAFILLLFSLCIIFISFSSKFKFLFICTFIIIIIAYSDFLSDILLSFSEKGNINGSSSSERTMQLNGVLNVISESPLWGLGIKGFNEAKLMDSDILGAESIWLQRLLSFGLIGITSQIYLYVCLFRYTNNEVMKGKRIKLYLFILSWIIFSTITSSPGLTEAYFLILLLILVNYEKNTYYECYEYK